MLTTYTKQGTLVYCGIIIFCGGSKVHGFRGLPLTIKYFIHNFEPELNLFLPLMFHCFKMFTQFSNKTGWKTLNAVLPKRQSSQNT